MWILKTENNIYTSHSKTQELYNLVLHPSNTIQKKWIDVRRLLTHVVEKMTSLRKIKPRWTAAMLFKILSSSPNNWEHKQHFAKTTEKHQVSFVSYFRRSTPPPSGDITKDAWPHPGSTPGKGLLVTQLMLRQCTQNRPIFNSSRWRKSYWLQENRLTNSCLNVHRIIRFYKENDWHKTKLFSKSGFFAQHRLYCDQSYLNLWYDTLPKFLIDFKKIGEKKSKEYLDCTVRGKSFKNKKYENILLITHDLLWSIHIVRTE